MATSDQATAAAAKVRAFLEGRPGLIGVDIGEKPNGYVVRVYGTNELPTADLPPGVDGVSVLVHRTEPPEALGYGDTRRSSNMFDNGVVMVLGGVGLLAGASALRSRMGSRADSSRYRVHASGGAPFGQSPTYYLILDTVDDQVVSGHDYDTRAQAERACAQLNRKGSRADSVSAPRWSRDVLEALTRMGWTRSPGGNVEVTIGGGAAGGAFNPRGLRIISAERKGPFLVALHGDTVVVKMLWQDNRPDDLAREFDARVRDSATLGRGSAARGRGGKFVPEWVAKGQEFLRGGFGYNASMGGFIWRPKGGRLGDPGPQYAIYGSDGFARDAWSAVFWGIAADGSDTYERLGAASQPFHVYDLVKAHWQRRK